jgi:glycosyltransferase involved in cell wall biosynthesis
MRLALISFEYPPAVAVGGIGTYAWHASHMLARAGHDVEVFTAGSPTQPEKTRAIKVFRVEASDRPAFREAVVGPFLERHRAIPFEVVESPEYGAEGAGVHAAVPELASVVRLHTPHFLVHELNRLPLTVGQRLRFSLGALRRGRLAWLRESQHDLVERDRIERENALRADAVAAPCKSILDLVSARWGLDLKRCLVFPNQFTPESALLSAGKAPGNKRVLFVGRLEFRKGILELALAIPGVLQRHPAARFVFVGPAMLRGGADRDTAGLIRRQLKQHVDSLEFTGPLDKAGVIGELAKSDIAVFPSRWENFPNVCLEAMSACRAVVASSAGGMAEMIEDGASGLLIPPRNPQSIAAAINQLLDRPETAIAMGTAARNRVLNFYSENAVLPQQLACYIQAVEHAKERQVHHH